MLLARPNGALHAPAPEAQTSEIPSDRLAEHCLDRLLGPAVVVLGMLQIAAWLPHYLTWPWWSDHDVFATMALGWDRGLLPYRDLVSNNFPGTIYLFWLAGRVAGWGRTWAFYALDAGLVLTLGLAMLAWGRARFGRLLPGAVGFAAFLGYYLGLDYTQAAQRDFQGPALAALALVLADVRVGWRSRLASAALAAAGFAIRPQTVLLWPAIALAVVSVPGSRLGIVSWPRRLGDLAVLGAALGGFIVLAFAPLIAAGVMPDFLRGLGSASIGGDYYRVTPGSFLAEMARQANLRDGLTLAGTFLLMGASPAGFRRSCRVWLVALGGVLLYRPLSPCPHAYLDHPRMLVSAFNLAVLAALVREAGPIGTPASFRLVAILALLGLGGSLRPTFVNPVMASKAPAALRSGSEPEIAPPGYRENREVMLAAAYPWSDYRETLAYLREQTDAGTRVANALEGVPALTAPSARLPVFPAESIAWLKVRPDDEGEFARRLESEPDSVVVWAPSEIGHNHRYNRDFDLPLLEPTIRRLYEPAARFGAIEVWRRAR
jgi:hypothetical protein